MSSRREFITLLGGAAATWPLAARAQTERTRRIGVMMGVSESDHNGQSWLFAFVEGLAQLGWENGRNVRIDTRWSSGDPNGPKVRAAELVSLQPDAMLVAGTLATSLVHQETHSIPVVAVQIIDPVASGFAASMSHPAGNITGFTNFEYAIGGKWIEALRELAPDIGRVGVVINPANVAHPKFARAIETAGSSFAVQVTVVPMRSAGEIEPAINAFARTTKSGLIVLPDTVTVSHRDLIVGLAARYRLPSAYPYRDFAAANGLMSYGPDQTIFYRHAATYVDRILRGARPADLPIQAPTKYELIINLKTAKALGLTVPDKLLASADEVIE